MKSSGNRFFVTVASTLIVVATLVSSSVQASAGKVITLSLTSEPPQLNTSKATDTASGFILGHVNEGLMRNGKNGETVPGVAEKYEINDKGATFHLRKTAKWSDGKPVTAKDFVFAWRLAVDPKNASEYAFILYPVKNAEAVNQGKKPVTELGVKAVDDYTLKVEFEKPCGYFLGLTAFVTYMPIREDFYKTRNDKYGAESADLLSNGPFVLSKWVHGASLQMDKNPNYWNAAAVKIDRIEIPYITNDNTAIFNFFKDKKIDMIERLGKDELPLAQKAGYRMNSYSDGSVWYMEFNFRDGRATKNKNLRKAIEAVFNPKEYTTKIVAIPGTKELNALIPSWIKGTKDSFRKEYKVADHKTDLAAAKKFADAARKELGGSIPALIWLCDDTPSASREAEYFQSVFKQQLGIDLKIDKQIFKQRLAKMTAGDFDIVAAGWGPDYADPMTFADLKTSWNENNRGLWKNAEYDKLIRLAQSTSNVKKRMDAMAAAEKIMLDDVAILPKYERVQIFVTHDRLKGVQRKQIGADPDLTAATVN